MQLLVVDMQKGLFTRDTPRHDAEGVIRRINRLIASVRKGGGRIIYIRHDGPQGDPLAPGTPGWEFVDELDFHPDEILIRKKACDAFAHTPLLDTIKESGDTRIIITGCATDFCVDTTVRSAAGKDIEVWVAGDAHTTADRPHLNAKDIITHHNWSWKNLILYQGKIRVAKTEDLIKDIET